MRVHTGAVPAVKQAVGHVALGVAHAVGQGGQGAAGRAAQSTRWEWEKRGERKGWGRGRREEAQEKGWRNTREMVRMRGKEGRGGV